MTALVSIIFLGIGTGITIAEGFDPTYFYISGLFAIACKKES